MNNHTLLTLSWLATALTIIAVLLLTRRNSKGWEAGILSNVVWVTYGILTKQWAIVVTNVILVIVNINGLRQWRRFGK